MAKPNPADLPALQLNGDGYNGLRHGLPARHTRLLAANVALIDLNDTAQVVSIRAHHRSAEFVEPSPRGLVAPQPQDALDPERIGTVLLAGDLPGSEEPQAKGSTGTMKDGSRRDGRMFLAAWANKQPPR